MKRQIIPEAFVNQRETIDKTLIEAQNQPSQYYLRRNNRRGPQTTNVSHFHSGSLSHSGSESSSNGQSYRYGWNQPQHPNQLVPLAPSGSNMSSLGSSVMGVDVYGFGNNTSKFGSTGPGVVHVPQIFDDQPVTKPLVSLVLLLGLRNPSDDSVVDGGLGGPNNAGGLLAGQPHHTGNGGLATFDPFNEKDHLWLFNSSNNFLGGNLAPSSSNIWGDNNKTDAAVWG